MHTIKFVSKRTGLSQHVIRAWEKRYGVLTPERTATNRRLYSTEDMEKLRLLGRLVQTGYSIGQVANLAIPKLRELEGSQASSSTPPNESPIPSMPLVQSSATYVSEALLNIQQMDVEGLEATLNRALATLGSMEVIENLLTPLLYEIGTHWQEGQLRIAHEHLASAAIRTFLGRVLESILIPATSPTLIITTPIGQMHELGALMVSVVAASEGWRIRYLGVNLPAAEIAGAVHQTQANVVALSIVHPPDDGRLPQELVSLRRYVGDKVVILVGGKDAPHYRSTLTSIDAIFVENLKDFRGRLEELRRSSQETLL